MEQYISKDALVAEIERLVKKNDESENVYDFGTEHALQSIVSFIDTLEVKEVQEEPKDKCKGCNNVKGCITCVDGSEWAHYEEFKAQKGEGV